MKKVFCRIEELFVNPLFEVFDGGDFILSSWRDIEDTHAEMRIFIDPAMGDDAVNDAARRLKDAVEIVGADAEIEFGEIPDDDWKLAYRRHFKIDRIGSHLLVVPTWDADKFGAVSGVRATAEGREIILLDPGMAFGTGKHETTRACLEYIDEYSSEGGDFLDMGCGSGILSIAAARVGYTNVAGFDVDQEAVDASVENAALNAVDVDYFRFALGRAGSVADEKGPAREYDFVVANILGPLLIRFAQEISSYAKKYLVISGILTEIYPEVLSAYEKEGFEEISQKTLGEWTTGLLIRKKYV